MFIVMDIDIDIVVTMFGSEVMRTIAFAIERETSKDQDQDLSPIGNMQNQSQYEEKKKKTPII